MISSLRIAANERGAAAVEMAFALPVLIVMIWMFVQLGQVYQAVSGMQHALGEGARYATLCLNPTTTGCSPPTATQVKARISSVVFGTRAGTFTVSDPVSGSAGSSGYYDLKVTYTQSTNLLFVPGPNISVSRSKRVWVAGT